MQPTGRPSLTDLAEQLGTDKAGPHSYTQYYERHLGHLRDCPVRLLEIGIGGYEAPDQGGASLRTWKAYFANGQIIGLDIHDKSALAEDRIAIYQGSQDDVELLERIAREQGPFNIVIDDGSHRSLHVRRSFKALFPHLVDGGIYVIEDLQTSYWERYGGSSRPGVRGTSMAMLKRLVDGLNHVEFDIPNYQPSYTDIWVKGLSFYHNLVFIEKGPNTEPSNLMEPHPHDGHRFAYPKKRRRQRAHGRGPIRRMGHAVKRYARRVLFAD